MRLALLSEQAFISRFLMEVGTPIFKERRVACTSTLFIKEADVILFCFSFVIPIIINIFENSFLVVLID